MGIVTLGLTRSCPCRETPRFHELGSLLCSLCRRVVELTDPAPTGGRFLSWQYWSLALIYIMLETLCCLFPECRGVKALLRGKVSNCPRMNSVLGELVLWQHLQPSPACRHLPGDQACACDRKAMSDDDHGVWQGRILVFSVEIRSALLRTYLLTSTMKRLFPNG